MSQMGWFAESQLHYGPPHQVAPRWKDCVLETERGFDLVLTDLLEKRTAHREVSIHGNLEHMICAVFEITNPV